ncbi:MAG TPA: hypothetical protein VEC11_11345 [Allosphingosinicella sp.]|nr:hypothetical protein [Allosphingosinicella sp.]
MAEGNLSGMQRMLRRHTSPELFAAMQRESRLWKTECPHCQTDTTDIWEIGGVRYKALGEPRNRIRCPRCNQNRWMRVHWTGGDPNALGPRPSVTPLVIKIVLITLLIPLAIVGAVLFFVLR